MTKALGKIKYKGKSVTVIGLRFSRGSLVTEVEYQTDNGGLIRGLLADAEDFVRNYYSTLMTKKN